jgi:hypothetical protein
MSAQPSIYVENEPDPVESVEISDPDAHCPSDLQLR